MKEFVDGLQLLSQLSIVQLLIVGIIGLVGWRIYLSGKTAGPDTATDSNRHATLLDLANLRQEIQVQLSARSKDLFDRMLDHEHRISTLEGERDAPQARRPIK